MNRGKTNENKSYSNLRGRGRGRGRGGVRPFSDKPRTEDKEEDKLPEETPDTPKTYVIPARRDAEDPDVPKLKEETPKPKVTKKPKQDKLPAKAVNISDFGFSLKDDPAGLDGFDEVEGFMMRPYLPRLEVAITCEGFVNILSALYDELCAASPIFTDVVALSVFEYYTYVLVWHRFVALRKIKGEASIEDLDFITSIDAHKLVVPDVLEKVIRAIGDCYDKDLGLVEVILPDRHLNRQRSFGQVDGASHSVYESYPALAVLEARMNAERRLYNARNNEDFSWDLPDDIRCQDRGCGLPTANLVGYRQLARLTDKQYNFMLECRLDEALGDGK